jgi:hypothetical protein
MSNSTTFRLTTDKKEGTWSLRGGSAKKNGVAKFINYWPGSNSIFDEDNKESIVKPKAVIFRYNDIISDPGVEIVVPNENKVLIDYLKAHPYFNIHYKIHNQNEIDEQKSQDYDKIEEALSLIKETDDTKVQAIALAVFGIDAYGWLPSKAKASLKEKAVTSPAYVIEQLGSSDYYSKYLAALAVYSGIIEEDYTRSAVVWNDSQKGTILAIAKGESGILKLAELLASESHESKVLLQEIGTRIDAKNSSERKFTASDNLTNAAPVKSEKEIADEAIEKYKASLGDNVKTEEQLRAEIRAEILAEVANNTGNVSSETIEQIQELYKEVTGNEAPARFKNDADWLKAKIAETKK